MTDLLHIMHMARARGWLEEVDRLQLYNRYVHAWVIFAEALGEGFVHARGPQAITPAQLDEIEKGVEKVYAGPLAMHRFQAALASQWSKAIATLKKSLEPMFRWRAKA